MFYGLRFCETNASFVCLCPARGCERVNTVPPLPLPSLPANPRLVECVRLKATITSLPLPSSSPPLPRNNAVAIHPDAFRPAAPSLHLSRAIPPLPAYPLLGPTLSNIPNLSFSLFVPAPPTLARPLESTIDSCNYPYLRHESNACLCIRVHGYLTDIGIMRRHRRRRSPCL